MLEEKTVVGNKNDLFVPSESELHYVKAAEILEQGVELQPKNYKVLYMISKCYIAIDDSEQALSFLDRAISIKPDYTKAFFEKAKLYKSKGYQLDIVGGAIRDHLMGKKPFDFDLVTNAKMDDALYIAKDAGYKTSGREINTLGVIRIGDIDVNTGEDIEGDMYRRDITINALYYDIEKKKIIDIVDGVEDIKNKTIRTIMDPYYTINENPYVKLRVVRFAAMPGFMMSPELHDAIMKDMNYLKKENNLF